jgi:hypothetical protein
MSASKATRLPIGVLAAATFLLLNGILRLFGLLYRAARASTLPPLDFKTIAYYSLSIAIALTFVLIAVAMFRRKAFSRKLGVGMLAYVAYLTIKKLAAVLIHASQNYVALIFVVALLAVTGVLIALLLGKSARIALP